MKHILATRNEVPTSQGNPGRAEGLGTLPIIAECGDRETTLKKSKLLSKSTLNASYAASCGREEREPKKAKASTSSSPDIRQLDPIQLYNTLYASKDERRTKRLSKPHTAAQPAVTNHELFLTTSEASQVFKVSTKTFLSRYAPLLHPIPSQNQDSQRRHLRWSRAEIERLAYGRTAPEFNRGSADQDISYVLRALEKRLE